MGSLETEEDSTDDMTATDRLEFNVWVGRILLLPLRLYDARTCLGYSTTHQASVLCPSERAGFDVCRSSRLPYLKRLAV